MNFRYDINALRAFAVISVVVFHFFAHYLPGGFVGVDIFFVISGFLMTKIIATGIEKKTFSLAQFYAARASRIIPALAIMCIVTLIVGMIYLTPWDLRKLGKHILMSMGFISNIAYLKESGYFDVAAQEKWLLHTWSLSVEWQFYLIYPIIILAIKKLFSIKYLNKLLWILTAFSFVLCLIYAKVDPSSVYYTLPTRAWELLLGGVAATQLSYKKSSLKHVKAINVISFFALIVSIFIFSSSNVWPNYYTALPVLATAIILYINQSSSTDYLSNRVINSLGLWSYSIYLWHWPVNVYIKTLTSNTNIINLLGLSISILLGFISYRSIEQYRPKLQNISLKTVLTYPPFLLMLLTALLGQLVYDSKGMLWRLTTQELTIADAINDRNPQSKQCHVEFGDSPECQYGNGPIGAIVLGDSHAQSVVRSIEKSAPSKTSTLDWTRSSCPTIKNVKRELNGGEVSPECGLFIESSINKVKSLYPGIPVFIINRTALYVSGANDNDWKGLRHKANLIIDDKKYQTPTQDYELGILESFKATVCEISQSNPVYLLKQTPELRDNVPKTMYKNLLQGKDDISVSITLNEYQRRIEPLNKLYQELEADCNVTVLDPAPWLCDETSCDGDINNKPMYFDDDHLSEYGAQQLIPLFKQAWGK
ncbi:acyltransferase [Vibrio sinensis]|uniref:Acyltransferase n=1 Tax=Vibrio sinensis TaxID=2302434 RepID=A0A3A6QU49_9VIBR|nr:acyltransferase family protein [Vibrio sinensis]RJX72394.1 acyltransferase [Vibrio sinensis]